MNTRFMTIYVANRPEVTRGDVFAVKDERLAEVESVLVERVFDNFNLHDGWRCYHADGSDQNNRPVILTIFVEPGGSTPV